MTGIKCVITENVDCCTAHHVSHSSHTCAHTGVFHRVAHSVSLFTQWLHCHLPINHITSMMCDVLCLLFPFYSNHKTCLQSPMLREKAGGCVTAANAPANASSFHTTVAVLWLFIDQIWHTLGCKGKPNHCMIKFKHLTNVFSNWFDQTNWFCRKMST